MTREEAREYAKTMTFRDAINNLMKARSIPYRKATFIKVNELLKALEQEPCNELPTVAIPQNNDGCENCRWQSKSESEMPCKQCMHNYTDKWEKEKPTDTITMEQEPKTGHWIEDTNGIYSDNHDTWECSECGHAQILNEGTPKENKYYFCPHCGARMD